MINILSYVGMNMQSELCLWTISGLVRTIFDATLFKVNANLIQVWQMSMPEEMSLPVQHVLRTMISGIILVQCFTVYVYLASYIVLLYPVFLEERPTLVLPWLLLAAIRKLLCELTSLALGLGTCILLGPAKPPCIKFLMVKISTILPAFYMWMLLYSYYHTLKLAATFKAFPVVVPTCDPDYGLELAVRRRRTKSLLGEQQLRENLVAGLYAEGTNDPKRPVIKLDTKASLFREESSDSSIQKHQLDILHPNSASDKFADSTVLDDWLGIEPIIPRRSDRILEQFVVMLLRIASYLKRGGTESINSQMFNTDVSLLWAPREHIDSVDVTETPPHVANSKGPTSSYIRKYPQIFMKKLSTEVANADVWQIQDTENIENHSSSQSINSNEHCNKINQEIYGKFIEKAVENLPLSKGKEPQQGTKLSAITSGDNSLHNLDNIDRDSLSFSQFSTELLPLNSNKGDENINKGPSLQSDELLLSNTTSTVMNKQFKEEDKESKVTDVVSNESETVNLEGVSSQQNTSKSDKK